MTHMQFEFVNLGKLISTASDHQGIKIEIPGDHV